MGLNIVIFIVYRAYIFEKVIKIKQESHQNDSIYIGYFNILFIVMQ